MRHARRPFLPLVALVGGPKSYAVDSGLAAAVAGVTDARAAKDRTLLGPLLETFVIGELRTQSEVQTNHDRYTLKIAHCDDTRFKKHLVSKA